MSDDPKCAEMRRELSALYVKYGMVVSTCGCCGLWFTRFTEMRAMHDELVESWAKAGKDYEAYSPWEDETTIADDCADEIVDEYR